MAKRELPSPDVLRQLLDYDPETGRLHWKARSIEHVRAGCTTPAKHRSITANWNKRYAGKEALTCVQSSSGYRTGAVQCVPCVAHRVAYAIYHGEHAPEEIDHINGNKGDNRIVNLRAVNHAENAKNVSLYSSNKSGVPGVRWEQSHKAWAAKINFGGKQRRIGRFKNKEDAIAARKRAEVEHGYHPNHGRLATGG